MDVDRRTTLRLMGQLVPLYIRRRPFASLLIAVGLWFGFAYLYFLFQQDMGLGLVTLFFAVAVLGGGAYAAVRSWHVEQAQADHIRLQQETLLRNVAAYQAMSASEFEHALAFLCERDGCAGVRVMGGAGDLGADVVAFTPDGRRLVIQAKRYGPGSKVSGPDLQRFGGTCFTIHGAHIAVVVTTSTFTQQALAYAHHAGIQLFDERKLAGWVSRSGPAPWH